MREIAEQTRHEDGEYRLHDHTGENSIYDALPVDVEGNVFWYPEAEVANTTDEESWKKFVVAEAGEHGEIEGTVYVLDPLYDTMGLLRFEDSERAVAMVAEGVVLQQVTGTMVTNDEWKVTHMHGWVEEPVYTAITELFEDM